MDFKALYFAEKLDVINPKGHIAICTLWSKKEYIQSLLEKNGVNLSPANSPIALIGNLYGNGLRQMIRNLLYNPQISVLVLFGQDLSGSGEDLLSFFYEGVEDFSENGYIYRRIKGRSRIIDTDIALRLFENNLVTVKSIALHKPKNDDVQSLIDFVSRCSNVAREKLYTILKDEYYHCHKESKALDKGDLTYSPPAYSHSQGLTNEETLMKPSEGLRTKTHDGRIEIPLKEVVVDVAPSNPCAHSVVAETPLEAWKEVVCRLYHFGIPVELKKGRRKELLNMKVVVNSSEPDGNKTLEEYGFSYEHFRTYQEKIISSDKPEDLAYSYGNRIRGYYKNVDFLDITVERLKKDIQDRHCYFSLWDSSKDTLKGLRKEGSNSAPCLASLYFRVYQGKLCLTACFRTHNGMDAWLENLYGLRALQRYVCDKLPSVERGEITVISHSISISHDDLERAGKIAKERHFTFSHDPHGQIIVSVEGEEIILQHSSPEGMLIKEYRSKKAEKIQHDLVRDMAIGNINHALYVGKLLAIAEQAIKEKNPSLLDGL